MLPLDFFAVVPGRLAGSSWPESKQASGVVDFLAHQSVRVLVNLTCSPYRSNVFAERFNLLHTPIANMTAPTEEQMESIWSAYSTLSDGEVMAVHCMKGLGRTGTVLACVLGRLYSLDASEAISRVRNIRPGSVESEEQERFIHHYLQGIRLQDRSVPAAE